MSFAVSFSYRFFVLGVVCVFLLFLGQPGWATQTENNLFKILPAPGKVVIDGKADDWDLSGGLYICDDVEHQRDQFGVWAHAMYDADYLYVLTRCTDLTPLNNAGQVLADLGFQGDCLQFRLITSPDAGDERASHWTCWRDREGVDVTQLQYGRNPGSEGEVKDAKKEGALQAFTINEDKKGYIQEIAIPWKLITKSGTAPKPGSVLRMTFEPNFSVGARNRLTIKDLFLANERPDRVFTFMTPKCWGTAVMESKPGPIEPLPVRLSDGRTFPVSLDKGVPVVDWKGLITEEKTFGFKSISFALPEDAIVSLNIQSEDGTVVRQLLNAAPFTKGTHEVTWDGLTTPNAHLPGQPVPAGDYTWSALYHAPIGIKLRGWAANGGSAPWDNGPTTNWGGDHNNPYATATDGNQVYLGWIMAEAGSALVACDLDGHVKWKNKRGGFSGVKALAADDGVLYVVGGEPGINNEGGAVYKLRAADGGYVTWGNSTEPDLIVEKIWAGQNDAPKKADGAAAGQGELYLSFASANKIAVIDGKTGKLLSTLDVPAPTALTWTSDNQLLAISQGNSVVQVNANGAPKTLVADVPNAVSLSTDKGGMIFVATGDPDNQVKVFGADGRLARTIGQEGGRSLLGKWVANAMRFISSISVAPDGKLWVAENDEHPRRISAWNSSTGALIQEFFGGSPYGAVGGGISPLDPNVMVGLGCEWRLDPATGHAACTAVISREGQSARFAVGSNGHLYLFTTTGWSNASAPVYIYERTGEAEYKLRAKFTYSGAGDNKAPAATKYWADIDDNQQESADEVQSVKEFVRLSSWYMSVGPDMTLYSGYHQFKVSGFTICGAPLYDFEHPVEMPNAGEAGGMGASNGLGSADGKFVIYNGQYQADRSNFNVYDIENQKLIWSYPDNYVGVHGSHNAGPPEVGQIRGAYDIVGTAKLPPPLNNIWVIGTNVGEWHILNQDGFYITRLFEPDPLKVKWPDAAVPGADMTEAPPGLGGEDFGGSIAYGIDGKLYLQAGKTGFWNLEVTGLDSVAALPGGKVTMSSDDVAKAQGTREEELQSVVGKKSLVIRKATVMFTGNLKADFPEGVPVSFQKSSDAAIQTAATWDDANLYLGWDVADSTPWQNGATAPEEMYTSGDTVDFQFGSNPQAEKKRTEAGLGDFRLSIGNFSGNPTAVLYRKISETKKPKVFSSGVIHSYPMDYVDTLADAKISVKVRHDGYTVEAAIPLESIGFKPEPNQIYSGDFGATHGDAGSTRTRLRTYWNNQHTGLVDDAVFELAMEPQNWGELQFAP
jgi:WD40 repeat protein